MDQTPKAITMTIGLITYDKPHRKTYDLACLLKVAGYDITLLTTPFIERKERQPLIEHRLKGLAYHPTDIAKAFGWSKAAYGAIKCDKYIIGGCNIITGLKALNAHPGYLPAVRGLDAMKWAIYHGLPVGVTVHETTDEVDEGKVIIREIVPLYHHDTFHSFAHRLYHMELQAMVDALEKPEVILDSGYVTGFEDVVHKRMPHRKEAIMLKRFEQRKLNNYG